MEQKDLFDPGDFIQVIGDNNNYLIVIYKEAPQTSVAQINLFFDYVYEVTAGRDFHFIVDLSETNPPNAEIRNAIKSRIKPMEKNVISYNLYVGRNILLKIAVKFVGASVGLQKFNVFNSIDEAKKYLIEKA